MIGAMNLSDYIVTQGGTATLGCAVLAAIAVKAECSAGTLYMIAKGHKTASAKLANRIEQATGGAVTRHDLRPDVFGPAPEAEAA
jgi:DNA-binding transcriptional regulator YdaS (Cro superfamily)